MDLRQVVGPLTPAERETVLALAARATAADGIAPLDEAALLALTAPPDTASVTHLVASETYGATGPQLSDVATSHSVASEETRALPLRSSDVAPPEALTSEHLRALGPTSSDAGEGGPEAGQWSSERGRIVGYLQLDRGGAVPTAQLVVDPDARRRGVGRALLDEAVATSVSARSTASGGLEASAPSNLPARATRETPTHGDIAASATRETSADGDLRAGGIREEPPDDDLPAGETLEVWAHGDLPAARALAAAAGFVPVHQLWRMAVDLARRPAVEATWPGGIVVRPFTPGHDERAWLTVNARAFADHPEPGRWTGDDLAAREREPWFDPAGFLLAERDGRLAGFAWTKVHPAGELGPREVGEIYVLGIDPAAQGQGLGRALTAAVLDLLAARGLATAVLWVAGDNAAAIRTYQRAGFARAALDVRYALRPNRSPAGAFMGS